MEMVEPSNSGHSGFLRGSKLESRLLVGWARVGGGNSETLTPDLAGKHRSSWGVRMRLRRSNGIKIGAGGINDEAY